MMLLFMGSWSLGFFALFASLIYVRLEAGAWPPADAPALPLGLAAFATATSLASSAAYLGAERRALRADRAGLRASLLLATGLAVLFLLLQAAAAAVARGRGLDLSAGPYSVFFWLISGFHAAHVGVAVVAGGWLSARSHVATPLTVSLWGMYWHGVGLLWILGFALIYWL